VRDGDLGGVLSRASACRNPSFSPRLTSWR